MVNLGKLDHLGVVLAFFFDDYVDSIYFMYDNKVLARQTKLKVKHITSNEDTRKGFF